MNCHIISHMLSLHSLWFIQDTKINKKHCYKILTYFALNRTIWAWEPSYLHINSDNSPQHSYYNVASQWIINARLWTWLFATTTLLIRSFKTPTQIVRISRRIRMMARLWDGVSLTCAVWLLTNADLSSESNFYPNGIQWTYRLLRNPNHVVLV